jgi:hypothetical protein
MNEVNMLNIGGVDYNVDDQHVRDVIAHSENGLDSQSNLPVSSRHYDEGDYLIGQDRLYYEATTDIEVGDVLAVGVNLRQTIISDEIVRLKNQSSLAVINVISYNEPSGLSSRPYSVGDYLYWDYGLSAGLYEVIDDIDVNDAFIIGTNIQIAPKLTDMIKDAQINYDSYNITGAKNLCPNNAADIVNHGITYDILSDGSVNVTGTSDSGGTSSSGNWLNEEGITLPAGTYKLTTGQSDEANVGVILKVVLKSNTSTTLGISNVNDGVFTLSSPTEVVFGLNTIPPTVNINVHVYPMCRVASVSDDMYVQHAMTNAQLTTAVSHVGMIIHSTTLDTEAKVKAIYGGVSWSKIEGRFLLGQNANYAINSTGGEEKHTLTITEMPSHTHTFNGTTFTDGGSYDCAQTGGGRNYIYGTIGYTGGSKPHNNMPPYKVVYIWERTA